MIRANTEQQKNTPWFAKAGAACEGRHEEAARSLERLVELSPENPLIWNDLGLEYAAMGDLDKAISAFRQGRAVYAPAFPPVLFNLGKLLLTRFLQSRSPSDSRPKGMEGLAEAIRLLNASLDSDPENIEAHALLAVAQERAGRKDIAEIHLRIVDASANEKISF
jgi:Flp pilus assembly protein TadD